MSWQRTMVLLAWILALVAPLGAARATTLVPMDLEQLVDQAELIFRGTALHEEVVLSREDGFPFTFVTFQVDAVLKGAAEGRHLTLRLHGGPVDDHEEIAVVGMPRFTPGEEYLLFVSGNGRYLSPVLGWQQGKFHFGREEKSGRRILTDAHGNPIVGIRQGQWMRAELPAPGDAGAVLVGEEGVVIGSSDPRAGVRGGRPAREVPEAGQVIQALRTFVQARAAAPSFVPGRTVRSADPRDVPARVGGPLGSPIR